ncbi:MAG: glycosyltransferase [Bacteroides sp.]|nr:glycosyltransferase [Ruminococcus flavefaciens]MCM1554532.1 glycosyltransferase [Bacteroides sp.]
MIYGEGGTGFALVVDQLADIIHRYTNYNVYVVCSAFKNEKIQFSESYTLLARNAWLCLRYLRLKDVFAAVSCFFFFRQPVVKQRFRIFRERLYVGLYAHYIKKYKPKVSFIHSLLPQIIPFVSASLRTTTPMMLVCHGDYATEKTTRTFLLGLAKLMCPPLLETGAVLSCVSSGVTKYFSGLPNVFVVSNPMPAMAKIEETDDVCISEAFNISVCGSICERKNQIQIVRALGLLTKDERLRLKVHFVGMDRMAGRVQKEAEKLGVASCCTFYGMVSRSQTLSIISHSQVTMTTTQSEAFGLPILEGYSFGVPAVFFADIAPEKELGDPRCALVMADRSDETVAEAIREAMKRDWDHAYIKKFSENFSERDIALRYADLFEKVSPNAYSEKKWNKLVRTYLRNKNQKYYTYPSFKQELMGVLVRLGKKGTH